MHNIKATSRPVILQLGGNYSVEIFSVTAVTEDNSALYTFAYIIDNGGMTMISMEIANPAATIDAIRSEAVRVIRHNDGLNRLLNEIEGN